MIRADLAASTNDCCALLDPDHRVVGIGLGAEIVALCETINRGSVLQKPLGDMREAVGIGTKWQSHP